MPHLSPMMWALIPLMFLSFSICLMSHIWWMQYPTIMPLVTNTKMKTPNTWTWGQ